MSGDIISKLKEAIFSGITWWVINFLTISEWALRYPTIFFRKFELVGLNLDFLKKW
jgi:hypothetical protein